MSARPRPRSIKIKICGITNIDDALMAIDLGADYIGLNLVAGRRKISLGDAMQIARHVTLNGRAVLLLDHWPQEWDAAPPSMDVLFGVQFYGPVDHPSVMQFRRQRLKLLFPLRVENADSLVAIDRHMIHMPADDVIWLLDAHAAGQLGGTGQTFNWSLAQRWVERFAGSNQPLIGVAGGLTPHNVADAIGQISPDLVDVSSGVEEPGRPGIKNPGLIEAFIKAVRGVNQAASGGGKV
jgi:phosphoribosylanthranilate isomerase